MWRRYRPTATNYPSTGAIWGNELLFTRFCDTNRPMQYTTMSDRLCRVLGPMERMLGVVWSWFDFYLQVTLNQFLLFTLGVVTREKVLTREPMNGGVPCPLSAVIETNGCYDIPCNDCDVPSYGPNGYPCFNGGACLDALQFDGRFSCNCSGTGYSGSNCQTRS